MRASSAFQLLAEPMLQRRNAPLPFSLPRYLRQILHPLPQGLPSRIFMARVRARPSRI